MQKSRILSSILDFPRRQLPSTLWDYSDPKSLPTLNPALKNMILTNAKSLLQRYNLELADSMLYGGAASYQWAPGTDIDVSLYARWPDDIDPEKVSFIQDQFKSVNIPFEEHPIHFYLKEPGEQVLEVSDAVYDVVNDTWVVPPLILPVGFDPDEYFEPFIKQAEKKAEQFDLKIGDLLRHYKILKKTSEAQEQGADEEAINNRLKEEKKIIANLIKELGQEFIKIREKRYAMHDKLREKYEQGDIEAARFERFQEPEIIWKYLDRSGYNDFLWKLYKYDADNVLDDILAQY